MYPDPVIGDPADAITHSCVCGSDLWPYMGMEASATGQSMGHETLGVVEDTGAEVRDLARSDPMFLTDGSCGFLP